MKNREIERKFLVKNNTFKDQSVQQMRITQGYLSSVPERTVRIRIRNNNAFITIKGIGNESGASRFEWEKEILVDDAKQLLAICEKELIDKTRFNVKFGGYTFEVDEFYGKNEGLIIAEIELSSENEVFEKPDWLGKEVTGKVEYYNAMLMKKPFKEW
ncbi:CYTH domain-containing protein [Polaribacter sp. Hel1_85]|uniref:CYTH domain-containing protein n=1 Tax=Polaribacter sp. Hel1_85 TaxID=1250005 RepID=UPI00052B71FF|nr:CYTH domain-containing protein [Polaribacter sp. Hel1_85]KGL64288.1 adenylate cyclase [Polaribacter sp. Hel1_85]